MSILGVDVHKYRVPGFIIIIFAVALVGTFTITKLHRRKSEDLKEISVLIKNGFQAVQRDELEDAKEIYLEIKEAYSALDQEDKAAIFKKVLKLGEEIDKTDMMELIKEYKLAKRKKAPESEVLYDKIKMKYTKLPKKFERDRTKNTPQR
jgi:flagellar motor component MotA